MRKKNKKGSVMDYLILVPIVFVMVITAIIGMIAYDQFHKATEDVLDPQAVEIMESAGAVLTGWDYILIIMIVGFLASTIVSAFFIQSHPIFFFASLFLLVVIIFTSIVYPNALEEMEDVEIIDEQIDNLPLSTGIIYNLPLILLALGILTIIVLYFKTPNI
jgi:magnesium-transporting ATPase (P-type)